MSNEIAALPAVKKRGLAVPFFRGGGGRDEHVVDRDARVSLGELVARLQRFYGGEPGGWLELAPPLLDAFAIMLPRLQAEEEIRLMNAVAAGTGALKPADRNSYVRALERGRDAGRAPRRNPPATLADLAAMGIRVKEVPKRG